MYTYILQFIFAPFFLKYFVKSSYLASSEKYYWSLKNHISLEEGFAILAKILPKWQESDGT
jgi:hypothetical protein